MRPAALLGLALVCAAPVLPPQPPPFPHAVATRGCTQEDAPALEVYLTRTPYDGVGLPVAPYVRLEVAWGAWARATGDPGEGGGTALRLVPLSRRGLPPGTPIARAESVAGATGAAESRWLTGTVRLRRVEEGRGAEGTYDLDAPPGGQRVSGSFVAAWVARQGGCG